MDALTIIICIQMHIVTLSHPADLTAKVGEMDKMNSHWHHLGGQCGGGGTQDSDWPSRSGLPPPSRATLTRYFFPKLRLCSSGRILNVLLE